MHSFPSACRPFVCLSICLHTSMTTKARWCCCRCKQCGRTDPSKTSFRTVSTLSSIQQSSGIIFHKSRNPQNSHMPDICHNTSTNPIANQFLQSPGVVCNSRSGTQPAKRPNRIVCSPLTKVNKPCYTNRKRLFSAGDDALAVREGVSECLLSIIAVCGRVHRPTSDCNLTESHSVPSHFLCPVQWSGRSAYPEQAALDADEPVRRSSPDVVEQQCADGYDAARNCRHSPTSGQLSVALARSAAGILCSRHSGLAGGENDY